MKPIMRLSGDQNTTVAFSVPASILLSSESSGRTQMVGGIPGFEATKASVRPSGDSTTRGPAWSVGRTPSGHDNSVRYTGGDGGNTAL
jgi:hypothetical protein